MHHTIILNNVSLGYEGQIVLRNISVNFLPGSLTAVVGPNGAGKSTLLRGISGVLAPQEGYFDFRSLNLREIAYLPQLAMIDRSFPISVLDTVLLGHWRKAGAWRRISPELVQQAVFALEQVGLAGLEKRSIQALSAGQFQRVLFARISLQDSYAILLDEPFNAVDTKTTCDLLQTVRAWNQENRTIVAVLHDLEIVKAHFPQTLLLAKDWFVWGKTEHVLTRENLHRAWNSSGAWASAMI